MVKVPQSQILTRAIEDCERDLTAIRKRVAEKELTNLTDACFLYHDIQKPVEEELDVLKQMYEIETGSPYA